MAEGRAPLGHGRPSKMPVGIALWPAVVGGEWEPNAKSSEYACPSRCSACKRSGTNGEVTVSRGVRHRRGAPGPMTMLV